MVPSRLALLAFSSGALFLMAPTVAGQNSPGDECIIQLDLHDELTTASLAFDLLFDDDAWANLTGAIDTNDDGFMSGPEVSRYESASASSVPGDEIPPNRRMNLLANFKQDPYSGTAAAAPQSASNETDLINFEGATDERAGKIVRETWTYQFDDPLGEFQGDLSLAKHAKNIVIKWGEAAEQNPEGRVAVIETVVVTAPADWWVQVQGERHDTYTFASGEGYIVTFVPDKAPRDGGVFRHIPHANAEIMVICLAGAFAMRRARH